MATKEQEAITQYLKDFGVTPKSIWEVREASERGTVIETLNEYRKERGAK